MNIYEELEKRRNDLLKLYEEDPSEQVAGIILGINEGLEAIKQDRTSAREELLKEIGKRKSPLWNLNDDGEPININEIYLTEKINSVLGEK